VAITAVARKLVTVAYLMLKNNEPYRYARPELMRKKFSELRAAGRGGSGASGPRRRLTAAGARLPEVYAAAGLPPATAPQELPAGERRMLTDQGLGGFVEDLYEHPGAGTVGRPGGRAKATAAPTGGRPEVAA
jgi:hypothetical protein